MKMKQENENKDNSAGKSPAKFDDTNPNFELNEQEYQHLFKKALDSKTSVKLTDILKDSADSKLSSKFQQKEPQFEIKTNEKSFEKCSKKTSLSGTPQKDSSNFLQLYRKVIESCKHIPTELLYTDNPFTKLFKEHELENLKSLKAAEEKSFNAVPLGKKRSNKDDAEEKPLKKKKRNQEPIIKNKERNFSSEIQGNEVPNKYCNGETTKISKKQVTQSIVDKLSCRNSKRNKPSISNSGQRNTKKNKHLQLFQGEESCLTQPEENGSLEFNSDVRNKRKRRSTCSDPNFCYEVKTPRIRKEDNQISKNKINTKFSIKKKSSQLRQHDKTEFSNEADSAQKESENRIGSATNLKKSCNSSNSFVNSVHPTKVSLGRTVQEAEEVQRNESQTSLMISLIKQSLGAFDDNVLNERSKELYGKALKDLTVKDFCSISKLQEIVQKQLKQLSPEELELCDRDYKFEHSILNQPFIEVLMDVVEFFINKFPVQKKEGDDFNGSVLNSFYMNDKISFSAMKIFFCVAPQNIKAFTFEETTSILTFFAIYYICFNCTKKLLKNEHSW